MPLGGWDYGEEMKRIDPPRGAPAWATISYPGASTTASDTVYQSYILGVFEPGPTQLNGFVARIPTSLLE